MIKKLVVCVSIYILLKNSFMTSFKIAKRPKWFIKNPLYIEWASNWTISFERVNVKPKHDFVIMGSTEMFNGV